MGNSKSKDTVTTQRKVTVTDYNKVLLPKEYRLLKIASYNVNMRNTTNLSDKIDKVISYLMSNTKNKVIDVLCLQGIRDNYSLRKLVKTIMATTDNKFYISPKLDNDRTVANDVSLLNSPEYAVTSRKRKNSSLNTTTIHNIIISRFPIVSDIYGEYEEPTATQNNDVFGIKTLNGANISVDGNIISVYSTELTKDIQNVGIVNKDKRNHEINILKRKIKKNMNSLQKNPLYNNYYKTDINIIVGSFHITEFINDELNSEFVSFIKKMRCVDLFRHLNGKEVGSTDGTDKRRDYVMLLLTPDVYHQSGVNNEPFNNISTTADLFKFIMKRYKLHCFEIYIHKSDNSEYTNEHLPIEVVFMISKNMH